jgi:hypothetical protein
VVVNLVDTPRENWSFGKGIAYNRALTAGQAPKRESGAP